MYFANTCSIVQNLYMCSLTEVKIRPWVFINNLIIINYNLWNPKLTFSNYCLKKNIFVLQELWTWKYIPKLNSSSDAPLHAWRAGQRVVATGLASVFTVCGNCSTVNCHFFLKEAKDICPKGAFNNFRLNFLQGKHNSLCHKTVTFSLGSKHAEFWAQFHYY